MPATKTVKAALAALAAAALACAAAAGEPLVLFSGGDSAGGVASAVYRIPALAAAPNGDLIAVCDARREHGGDLNSSQPISIAVRRSPDGGKSWTAPVFSWDWRWDDKEKWAASDPSLIVDGVAKKVFLLFNVWECVKGAGVYRFFVQESSDDGKTWSKPRDITGDLAFPEWPFGSPDGFIFITSGSGVQTKDGTLLHTIVRVNVGNAVIGSPDHGKTWKTFGKVASPGDECKVVELSDGAWMINSRWRGGGRQIHVSRDRGETWESRYDAALQDPQCNAQLMRCGKYLLFSNCKSPNRRHNLYVRASRDSGETWSEGFCVEPMGAAYSDMALMPDGKLGVIYEGAGYETIKFRVLEPKEFLCCGEAAGK